MRNNTKLAGLLLASLFLLFSSFNASAQFVNTVVSITGSVTDAINKQPVTVKIQVFDETGKKINTTKSNASDNGYYYITGLKPGKTYFLSIVQEGYLNEKFKIEIPNTDKYTEISRDFLAIPLENGAKFAIPVPPFELNKSKLRYGAEELLSNLKNTLTENPDLNFEITCYPDNNNNAEENRELTEDRCNSLKSYLVSNGIDASRITISGTSTTDPQNPPPVQKRAKGKRYVGTTYIVLKKI